MSTKPQKVHAHVDMRCRQMFRQGCDQSDIFHQVEGSRTDSRAKLQEGVVGGQVPQTKYLAGNSWHHALEAAKGKAGHSCRDAWES